MSDDKTTFKVATHRIGKSTQMIDAMIRAFQNYFISVPLVDKVRIEVYQHNDFLIEENKILKNSG